MRYLFIIFLFLSLNTQATPDKIKKADLLYEQREDISNVWEAKKIYEELLAEGENETLWRLSMVHYYIGHKDKEESKRIEHYNKGVDYGRKCREIFKDRRKVECSFWLASNLALLKKENGIFSLAFNLSEVIELFEEAKTLDPLFAGAGPYRMLALLYYKAPGILGGDNDKAFSYIEKAIELKPNEPLNYYFYVKILLDESENEKAKELTKKYLERPRPKKWAFFESKRAYKRLVVFYNTGDLPKSQ